MFLKLSIRIDTLWKIKASTSLYTANVLFSIFILFFSAIFILPFTNRENSNSLGLLPLIFGILVFILNYNFLIKNDLVFLEEKEFDQANDRIKNIRVILFFCLLLIIIVSFFLVSKSILFRTDRTIFLIQKPLC